VVEEHGEVDGGSVDLHADLPNFRNEHRSDEFRNGVVGGIGPLDHQRHQLAVDHLVAQGVDALLEGFAVFVQSPAASDQFLLGLLQVVSIGVQFLVEPVGVLLVLPHGSTVIPVDDDSETTGVLAGELVAVKAVGDRTADAVELGGSEVAGEGNLAIAIARIEGVIDQALVIHVEAAVDLHAAADALQHVDRTGLELVHLGGVVGQLDDDAVDRALGSVILAQETGVQHHAGGAVGRIEVLKLVGARGDQGLVTIAGSRGKDGLAQQVGIVSSRKRGTLAGIGDGDARSQHVHRDGADRDERKVEEVRQLGGFDGDGERIVVQQPDSGECPALAAVEILVTDIFRTRTILGAQFDSLGRRGIQDAEHIVLGGDLGTIVVGEVLSEVEGVRLGTVGVHYRSVGGNSNRVDDITAFLGPSYSSVAAHQLLQIGVGGTIGPTIEEIAVDLGRRTQNHLRLRSGCSCCRCRFGVTACEQGSGNDSDDQKQNKHSFSHTRVSFLNFTLPFCQPKPSHRKRICLSIEDLSHAVKIIPKETRHCYLKFVKTTNRKPWQTAGRNHKPIA